MIGSEETNLTEEGVGLIVYRLFTWTVHTVSGIVCLYCAVHFTTTVDMTVFGFAVDIQHRKCSCTHTVNITREGHWISLWIFTSSP